MRSRNKCRSFVALFVPVIVLNSGSSYFADEPAASLTAIRFRGPVALVLFDDGKTLLSANRRSGSITVVDTPAEKVIDEIAIGKRLSALVAVPGKNLLLAADEEAHEVILVARQEGTFVA